MQASGADGLSDGRIPSEAAVLLHSRRLMRLAPRSTCSRTTGVAGSLTRRPRDSFSRGSGSDRAFRTGSPFPGSARRKLDLLLKSAGMDTEESVKRVLQNAKPASEQRRSAISRACCPLLCLGGLSALGEGWADCHPISPASPSVFNDPALVDAFLCRWVADGDGAVPLVWPSMVKQ